MFIHEWLELFVKVNKVDLDECYLIKELVDEMAQQYEFYMEDPKSGWLQYDKCQVITLKQFSKLGKIHDFIYDRSTQMVIIKFRALCRGCHEGFICKLAEAFYGNEDYYLDRMGELYSINNGFFLSSISYNKIYIGKDTVLTPEEKRVFSQYDFIREL